MKISEFLQCAKPLILSNDDEAFPYSSGGTCFLFSFKSHYLALTTAHAFKDRSKDCIRISYREDAKRDSFFLPTIEAYNFDVPLTVEDSDYLDLVVVRFDREIIEREYSDLRLFFNIEAFMHGLVLGAGDSLVTRGFPGTPHNDIDHDNGVLKHQALLAYAEYLGYAEFKSQHIHSMGYADLTGVDNLNGMSGAPVFKHTQDVNGKARLWFVGMIIRGGAGAMQSHFIGPEAFMGFLLRLEKLLNTRK